VVVAPPQLRVKFCPSPEKKTLIRVDNHGYPKKSNTESLSTTMVLTSLKAK
jgi:hypothetical protein